MTKLTFDEYQQLAMKTAIYPREYAVMYPALGLAGEAGEVCEKIKKGIRDHGGEFDREALAVELGDVLWYVAVLANDLSIKLSECSDNDIIKNEEDTLSIIDINAKAALLLLEAAVELSLDVVYGAGRDFLVGNIHVLICRIIDMAHALDTSLEDIARANLAKLADRAERGTIRGEGDDR